MEHPPQALCIGSVLWDIIGRAPQAMRFGNDVAGRIIRLPGGVAMNIAMALNRFGIRTALLSAVGTDAEGDELIDAAQSLGLITSYLYRSKDLPTDSYMAIEGQNGLIAAIADAHSLEAAGHSILTPLRDGRLAGPKAHWRGIVALDGNLTSEMLEDIARDTLFDMADLRIAPASPGKAERLKAFLGHPHATLYLNMEEARLLTGRDHATAAAAAEDLITTGLRRVVVTNGGEPACVGSEAGLIEADPPKVEVRRVTGAGDTFMAGHIAAEIRAEPPEQALHSALEGAAAYISQQDSI